MVVDEPQGFKTSVPPVVAATSPDLAMVRFHGHNEENWEKRGHQRGRALQVPVRRGRAEQVGSPAHASWPAKSKQLHILMNNCYADYGVRNAAQFAGLLAK